MTSPGLRQVVVKLVLKRFLGQNCLSAAWLRRSCGLGCLISWSTLISVGNLVELYAIFRVQEDNNRILWVANSAFIVARTYYYYYHQLVQWQLLLWNWHLWGHLWKLVLFTCKNTMQQSVDLGSNLLNFNWSAVLDSYLDVKLLVRLQLNNFI